MQVSRSGFAPLVTLECLVVGPAIIGAFLRIDEVARGSYFDTFAGRGSQCKVVVDSLVWSRPMNQLRRAGAMGSILHAPRTFTTSIPTQW